MSGQEGEHSPDGTSGPLDDTELQSASGGMTVSIEHVETTVKSAGSDNGVSGGIIQKVIGAVLDSIKKDKRPS